jgi:hypothetical protein
MTSEVTPGDSFLEGAGIFILNPLNAELNPIRHLLAHWYELAISSTLAG